MSALSPGIVSFLIWLPFILLAIGCGAVFTILGYKRGAAKAALSLLVTALTAALSVLLARLFSTSVGSILNVAVRDVLTESGGLLWETESFSALIIGIATALGALMLFPLILLILLVLLKNLTSFVFTQRIPAPKSAGNRLGGAAIALVDALLVAFLFLLPLYGTLSVGNEVVRAAESFTEERDHEFASVDTGDVFSLLRAACDTGLSRLSGKFPFSFAYDGLAGFSYHGDRICLSRAAKTTARTAYYLNELRKGDESAKEPALAALDRAETLVTGNDLFPGLVRASLTELTAGGRNPIPVSYRGLDDERVLRGDLVSLFDVARAAVRDDLVSTLSHPSDIPSEKLKTFSRSLAAALNRTESLAEFKASLVEYAVGLATDSAISALSLSADTVGEIRSIIGTIPKAPLSEKEIGQEGDALYLILVTLLERDSSDPGRKMGNLIEGLSRHPYFGVEKASAIARLLLNSQTVPVGDTIADNILDTLQDSVSKPVGESEFGDFTSAAYSAASVMQELAEGSVGPEPIEALLRSDPDALTQIGNTLKEEIAASGNGADDASEKITQLFSALPETVAGQELSDEKIREEASALSEILSAGTGIADPAQSLADGKITPDELIDTCLRSDILIGTLSSLIASDGPDPLSLRSSLSEEEARELTDLIRNKAASADAETAAKLETVADFLGLRP